MHAIEATTFDGALDVNSNQQNPIVLKYNDTMLYCIIFFIFVFLYSLTIYFTPPGNRLHIISLYYWRTIYIVDNLARRQNIFLLNAMHKNDWQPIVDDERFHFFSPSLSFCFAHNEMFAIFPLGSLLLLCSTTQNKKKKKKKRTTEIKWLQLQTFFHRHLFVVVVLLFLSYFFFFFKFNVSIILMYNIESRV